MLLRRRFGLLLCAVLLVLLQAGQPVASAATAKKNNSKVDSQTVESISGSVTQSYNADPTVQIGMLVSLKPKDPSTVVPFSGDGVKNLLGITIPNNQATIVLTPQKTKSQQILVTSTGQINLLVSNQNGPIKQGDYLTTSAVNGIGMKADATQQTIVGRAAGDFAGNANVISTVELVDNLGKKTKVSIGEVKMK